MANYLDVGDSSAFEKKLLINQNLGGDGEASNQSGQPGEIQELNLQKLLTPIDRKERSQAVFVIPQPGLCVKTVDAKNGGKIFMNVCYSDEVPAPNFDYPDDRLAQILDEGTDDDIEEIRIPLSIGEKHSNPDNNGIMCETVDVVVNTAFYLEKIAISELYKTFLIQISLEGISEKYKYVLERNAYKVLENRKCFGKLQPQFVRQKPEIKEIKEKICEKSILGQGKGDGSDDLLKPISTTMKKSQSQPLKKTLIEEVIRKPEQVQLKCVVTQLSKTDAKAEIIIANMTESDLSTLNVYLGLNRILIDCPHGKLDAYLSERFEIDVKKSTKFKSEFSFTNQKLIISFNVNEKN